MTVLVVFTALHLLLAIVFRVWLGKRRRAFGRDVARQTPPAVVLIAARGRDPSFERMLRAVVSQDYPDFQVVIAADGLLPWNPGWLPGWLMKAGSGLAPDSQERTHVLQLEHPGGGHPLVKIVSGFERLPNCGLKCSALLGAWREIPPSAQLVAFLDTDIVPRAEWLSDLAAVAMQTGCGVATGVQWFQPPDLRTGSMVRSLWNAAAMFPTVLFANPWAGSMALRREVIERSGLLQRWRESVVDDGPVRAAVNEIGLQTVFVPTLVMTNPESCSAVFAVNWMCRMMKWSSIYEPQFRNTVAHVTGATLLLAGAAAITVLQILAGGQWWWSVVAVTVSGIFFSGSWCVMSGSRQPACDRDLAPDDGHRGAHRGATIPAFIQLVWAVPLSYVSTAIFSFATFRALFSQRYRWRGVDYTISRNGSVVSATERFGTPTQAHPAPGQSL